jgi:hypothetical protein
VVRRFAKANNTGGCTSGDVVTGRVALAGKLKELASEDERLPASLVTER